MLERQDIIDTPEGYRLRMEPTLKGIATDIVTKTAKIDTERSILAIQQLIED